MKVSNHIKAAERVRLLHLALKHIRLAKKYAGCEALVRAHHLVAGSYRHEERAVRAM